jgi:hypothetical protein
MGLSMNSVTVLRNPTKMAGWIKRLTWVTLPMVWIAVVVVVVDDVAVEVVVEAAVDAVVDSAASAGR